MARSGLSTLLLRLRELTATGYSDYAINNVAYWTDDQLQVFLDRYRTPWRYVALTPHPDYIGGVYSYTDYHLPSWATHLEESAGFRITTADGTAISSSLYTVNFEAGIVTFTTDQANVSRFADFRSYDLNRAAADVWEAKAAHIAERVDFRTDNHQMSASQYYEHCVRQSQRLRGMGGVGFAIFRRVDEA